MGGIITGYDGRGLLKKATSCLEFAYQLYILSMMALRSIYYPSVVAGTLLVLLQIMRYDFRHKNWTLDDMTNLDQNLDRRAKTSHFGDSSKVFVPNLGKRMVIAGSPASSAARLVLPTLKQYWMRMGTELDRMRPSRLLSPLHSSTPFPHSDSSSFSSHQQLRVMPPYASSFGN